ncbi:putative DNA-binding transcriptional regulator AlpA [Inquilinus ginsengisoli]|uniref:helix-turn-helix transcriptional regulator n=1 Tax=Inquilinus ginsengisoli TaxID=363840 RepID=UPI003D1CC333
MEEIIRVDEVVRITGMPVSTLYRWIEEGRFPRQVKLGPRAVGWYRREVKEWADNRPRKPAAGSQHAT